MNSTNVPSNNDNQSRIRLTGGNTGFSEGKEIRIKGTDIGKMPLEFKIESVGPAVLTKDGILHMNGKNLAMKNPNAYENVKKMGKERIKLTRPSITTGIDR